jgi:TPR repeat protein
MLGLSSSFVYAHEGVDAYRIGDYKRAAVEFYKSEPQENWAKYYIAEMYAYGYGFPKNSAKAREFNQEQGMIQKCPLLRQFLV